MWKQVNIIVVYFNVSRFNDFGGGNIKKWNDVTQRYDYNCNLGLVNSSNGMTMVMVMVKLKHDFIVLI